MSHLNYSGTWPDGEPQSVRDAYDKMLAEQTSSKDKDGKATDGKAGR
ncbi:hypothetical protein AB0395_29760 [Streptosporangium sp. NPDC051023]